MAEQSLGYSLYNNGYNCYYLNVRGNGISTKHQTLDIKQSEFWDFTLDQIADNDLRPTID